MGKSRSSRSPHRKPRYVDRRSTSQSQERRRHSPPIGLKEEVRGKLKKPSIEKIYKSPFTISDVAYSSKLAGSTIAKLMQEIPLSADIDRQKPFRKKRVLGYVPLIRILK
mmetsp:Transcript_27611/g.49817  ORF Transcript_27611/g.49817 Transcript_27611/m.49817 type:complete len:110 (-) Transcript_27611:1032-1361(-)